MERLIETICNYLGTATVFVSYNDNDICNFNITNPYIRENDNGIDIVGDNDESIFISNDETVSCSDDGLDKIFTISGMMLKKSIAFL